LDLLHLLENTIDRKRISANPKTIMFSDLWNDFTQTQFICWFYSNTKYQRKNFSSKSTDTIYFILFWTYRTIMFWCDL